MLFCILFIVSYRSVFTQTLEISYLTGASTSLFNQNNQKKYHLIQFKNSIMAYPNFIGEASVGLNVYKEKIHINIGFNQLTYAYRFKTAFIYPDFFAKDELTEIYATISNNVISTTVGYNYYITPKVFFRPFVTLYLGFNRGISSSGYTETFPVPYNDGTINQAKMTYEDQIRFNSSLLFGVGYKFNFFVTPRLFISIGSRYNRGFRKDFTAKLTLELKDEVYESEKFLRSSNFSIDIGLGAKINLKKWNK